NKYPEAAEAARRALEFAAKVLGETHYRTITLRAQSETLTRVAGWSEEQRAEWATADRAHRDGEKLLDGQKFAGAGPLLTKALEAREKLAGEGNLYTSESRLQLARCLMLQGKLVDARRLYEQALQARLKVVGEHHPATAHAYNGLAANFAREGRHD